MKRKYYAKGNTNQEIISNLSLYGTLPKTRAREQARAYGRILWSIEFTRPGNQKALGFHPQFNNQLAAALVPFYISREEK